MLQLYVGLSERYVGLSEKIKTGVSENFRKFRADLSGATAIEYGLIAGLIGVVIIGALVLLGPELSNLFNTITSKLKGAGGGP